MAGRRSPTSYYRAVPQEPTTITQSESLEIDGEDEENLNLLTREPSTNEIGGTVRWIHFVLGCAVLLPWNALITTTPYFLSRMQGSALKGSFSSYLSMVFTAANFGFLTHATATSKEASPSRRVIFGLLTLAIMSALLTLSTYFRPSPGVFFTFIIFTAIVMGGAGSYVQIAVVAGASLFGPGAMQAVMSGQGAVGAAVSLIQLLGAATAVRHTPAPATLIILSEEEDAAEVKSAFLFFGISTIFLVGSAASHVYLTRMPVYETLVAPLEQGRISRRASTAAETEGLVSSVLPTPVKGGSHIMHIAKANAIFNFTAAYVFIVTLSVFPPITILINSTNPATHPLFFSAFHFLLFNLGDFSGRSICGWSPVIVWSAKKLLTMSLARTLFIPLFLMCNVQRPSTSNPILASPIISSDFLYLLILFFFGFSNGYVSSLVMMAAPSVEHNPRLKGRREDVDVAATVGSFCIVGGLAIGSLSSFAVSAAVCQCNPFN